MWSSKILGLSANLRVLNSVSKRNYSSNIKDKKIGLIGLGNVGDAVLFNLRRGGFNVVSVTDINASRASQYRDQVQHVRATNREVAEDADVIVTSLPMPPDVKKAVEGADGLMAGLGRGKVWIEHSTTDSKQSAEFADRARQKGTRFLEAPITGGMDALKKGQMACFAAGDKDTFQEVKPILDASYQSSLFCGPLGAAMVPKVAANMICALNIVAMGEMLMVAKRHNVDLTTFWHAIRLSCGNSFLWETGGPFLFNGNYDPSFTIALHTKDIRLHEQMAKDAKVPTELLSAMQRIYERALEKYGDGAPCYIPPKLLEDELGEDLRVAGFQDWSYEIDNKDGAMQVRHHGIELPTGSGDKK